MKIEMTPKEMKSLAYLFVHEMQNNNHCAMDWKSREQIENIICKVLFGDYNVDITRFERRVNAMIMVAETSEYPEEIERDIKRIRRRIWEYLKQTRQEYYGKD